MNHTIILWFQRWEEEGSVQIPLEAPHGTQGDTNSIVLQSPISAVCCLCQDTPPASTASVLTDTLWELCVSPAIVSVSTLY